MAPTREQLGQGTRITLFGRFRTLPKKRIEHLLKERGAQTLRDLTRNSTHLVVGESALGAFDMLLERLRKADRQNVAVLGERRLMDILSGQTDFPEPTLPVDKAALPCVSHTGVSLRDENSATGGCARHRASLQGVSDLGILCAAHQESKAKHLDRPRPNRGQDFILRRPSRKFSDRNDITISAVLRPRNRQQ